MWFEEIWTIIWSHAALMYGRKVPTKIVRVIYLQAGGVMAYMVCQEYGISLPDTNSAMKKTCM